MIGRAVAKNQGAPDAKATTAGFLAGLVRSPALGIALVSRIARSQASSISTSGIPSSQLIVTARPQRKRVILTWNAINGANRYNVVRLDRGGARRTAVPWFVDDSVVADTDYVYQVEAFNKNKSLVKSSIVLVETP